MTSGRTFEVEGLSDLLRRLEALPDKIHRQIEQKGIDKATAPILESARSKARGSLKDSIKRRTLRRRYIVKAEVYTDAPHAHLVEYGHRIVVGGTLSPRKSKRGWKYSGAGRVIGRTNDYPFMRPAIDENVDRVIGIFQEVVAEALAKAEEKAG